MPVGTAKSTWVEAAESLAERSDLAAELLARHGAPNGLRRTSPARRFASLAESIAYQQLSSRAAATIWSRVVDVVGDPFDPAGVLATEPEALRAAGLSTAKVRALVDLAERCGDGTLRLERTGRMGDEQVIAHLVQVRGVGVWTAQMFCIFDLGRTDVWPTGDLGVRTGWARLHGHAVVPAERDFVTAGDDFAPYRSVMAWWCWREVDG